MTVRIGLTGPIACGKSTVAGWLAGCGAAVVDADDVARRVRAEPAVRERIVARFGTADPAALATIVFADEAALRELEAIVHPAVRPRILEAIAAAERASAPAVVIEAIKLVEGGLAELCDEVWLVHCDPVTQRERLLARGMAVDDAEQRIAAQAELVDRVGRRTTRAVQTSGDPLATRRMVEGTFAAALAAPRTRRPSDS